MTRRDTAEGMGSVRWAFRCGSWTPSRCDWLFAARCIQREEKERIGQFVFAKDAKSAMVSSGSGGAWSFNLSHQGDYAVLAAEQGLQVGVDIMKNTMPGSKSVSEFFRIMTRQFTAYEWSIIQSAAADHRQLAAFYRHWALKESFIKAIGTGLDFDLQRAEFHLPSEPPSQDQVLRQTKMHLDGKEEGDWIFEESLLDVDHHVAVALGPADKPDSAPRPSSLSPPTTFTLLSFSELVASASPLTEEDPAYWDSFEIKAEAPQRQRETHVSR
ncbi:L-aminoadipate-semialdehyde dehydrogenase-phosphopantetheinyl transferase isoform X3 [Scophthalmus maximus]|uniref:L-aminoadipate-semialdehyde dehydrogenase-phosphopantetheinyl transferase isoform X3 n=1 Tax=Scophthalmus maximus TaxID=52904 RepID=UPI0015E0CC07|nr:L-aminoadipate-semialdehyde dehydrogenase-phosphopantetheinyl transferase isoform X3 [Scophthalmus maximus]